jgi:hypothetical protein
MEQWNNGMLGYWTLERRNDGMMERGGKEYAGGNMLYSIASFHYSTIPIFHFCA